MRFMLVRSALAALLIAIGSAASYGMVLTEIMYDPDGDESTDEFIEIYNDSTVPMNLDGWRVTDGSDTDRIVAAEGDLHAVPGQYVLILDPDYMEDGSTTYDGLVPENALIVTIDNSTFGSRGLSNSAAERVALIGPHGETSAWTYTLGNAPGYSDEKVFPTQGDSAANWADAIIHNGTPGGRNSVTPPDHDLAVINMESVPPVVQVGDSFEILITVRNVGQLTSSDTLTLLERFTDTSSSDSLVPLRFWPIYSLPAGDSVGVAERLPLQSSLPRLFVARLSGGDERDNNDQRMLTVSPEGVPGSVLVNEIMYQPEPGMSEWVELVNSSPASWNLSGWRFGDGTGIADSTRRTLLPDILLPPQGLAVLSADSTILFESIPSAVPVVVWNVSTITLNNNGDSLVLYDAQNVVVDRVDYRPSWGSGMAGNSIERISPASPSNDPLNWASSLDSTGATPGRPNSRALPESVAGASLLELVPNPFSPDGDGVDDVLAVRFRLDHPDSRLNLKIFDVRGRMVRRLANNEPAGYSGERLWDGRDGNGRDLPTGLYVVYLEALGKAGTRVQSDKRVIALARRS